MHYSKLTGLLGLMLFGLLALNAPAQTGSAVNYQSALRDAAGAIMANQQLTVRFSVLQGAISGPILYEETHMAQTGPRGIVNLQIGNGNAVIGNWQNIPWHDGDKFLKVEIDAGGGYVDLGTQQMVSVPYALHASNTGKIGGNPVDVVPPATGEVLKWNGTAWAPAQDDAGGTPGGAAGGGLSGNYPNPDIADNAVTATKLANSSVTADKLVDNAVTTDKINNAAVTADKLHQMSATDGQVLKWNGTAWAPDNDNNTVGWGFGGNAVSASNFIGTTNNQPLRIRVNNENAGSVHFASMNTALGYHSLNAVTTGVTNTAIGRQALFANTTGNANTATGYGALYSNTTGGNNTATGLGSLYFNTSGEYNAADGIRALYSNTTGTRNTAVGAEALYSNTTGGWNTASGYQSLYSNTTGWFNTAQGYRSLYSNTTGNDNTATGYESLHFNTTGNANTAMGILSLRNNTTGSHNTALGYQALQSNTTGNHNTASGTEALYSNTTGQYNTASGYQALRANTIGSSNAATGYLALRNNTAGGGNVAIGYYTLQNNTSGSFNTAIGYDAYNSTAPTANNTTAIGNGAGVGFSNRIRLGDASVNYIGGQVPWTASSDGRIKKNISDNVPGLSFIQKLRPVTYTFDIHKQNELLGRENKSDYPEKYEIEGITQTGLIAQEVEAAAAELGFDFSGVSKPRNENDLYGLRYSDFVMPLIKAIQEQQQMIEQQREIIRQLEQRVEALEQ